MARKYKVKGTNDFLIGAVLLFALGLWAIRDGWYPSQRTLAKYPLEMALQFETEGVVAEVAARPDMEVRGNEVLARLRAEAVRDRMDGAETELAALAPGAEEAEALQRRLNEALAEMARHELRAPTGGVIRAVLVERNETVGPEDTVAILDPQHHFYPFNKSLAWFSMIGAVVCLVIHFKVR